LQTLEDPLSQFMLHPILVREFPYLADESEVHRKISEPGDKTNKGFGLTQKSVHVPYGLLRLVH